MNKSKYKATAIALAASLAISSASAVTKYQIVSDDAVASIKRSVVVLLYGRPSAEELKAIALKIKAKNPKSFDRTFIMYRLKGADTAGAAWATTHFNPGLEVKILGTTDAQAKAAAQSAKDDDRDIIGIWLDESPYIGSKRTLFRENGSIFMEMIFNDGSSMTKELEKTATSQGARFEDKGGNEIGEYFILTKNGTLHAAGRNGIFATYKKLR